MTPFQLNLWDRLRTNFWLVPALFGAAALATAILLPGLDALLASLGVELPTWLRTTNENARSTLAAIGTAMITVTGTVFSVTIVALSLASQQFGPRLLRRFMNDLPTQFTLAVFLSTGFFCLFALRSTSGDGERSSAADLAVALAELLAIVSAGMLIVYIHHIAVMIQASTIVAAVAGDLDRSIDDLFPEMLGAPAEQAEEDEGQDGALRDLERAAAERGEPLELGSRVEGYLQTVDGDELVELARRSDALVRLRVRPGDFVALGDPVADTWPARAHGPAERDALERRICACLLFGPRPTPRQDPEAAVDELVQVAVRALSAGVNDPLTAIHCIHRLAAALGRLAQRRWPSSVRLDAEDRPRVATRAFDFRGLLDTAFDPVRRYGRGQVAVTAELLHALERVARRLRRPGDAATVRVHADLLARSVEAFPEERDREVVLRRHAAVLEALSGAGTASASVREGERARSGAR